ncbi:putative ATP-dependent RNA helicase DHX29 isoform X1 [Diplonema papillatum]|nr:putative ATP-dependent RNA helicase DHX29 isoform X1 [Diplonema papillatum]
MVVVVLCHVIQSAQVEAAVPAIRQVLKEMKTKPKKKVAFHVFYPDTAAGEEAKNALQVRMAELRGDPNFCKIATKVSSGRIQDDLVARASCVMWDIACKGHTVDFVTLLSDYEGGMRVHFLDLLASAQKASVNAIVDNMDWATDATRSNSRLKVHLVQALENKVHRVGGGKTPMELLLERADVKDLPAAQGARKVLQSISEHRVVLLSGPTGSGKSTILPLAARAEGIMTSRMVKIVVAQPRRLAAVSLCDRTRELTTGSAQAEISYRIGMDDRCTPYTTLEFTTYGLLCRLLCRDPQLEGYTHVFIDEVHERMLDIDFTLALLLPAVRAGQIKLIVMSATCSMEPLKQYFREHGISTFDVIELAATRQFSIEKRSLHDIVKRTKPERPVVGDSSCREPDWFFRRYAEASGRSLKTARAKMGVDSCVACELGHFQLISKKRLWERWLPELYPQGLQVSNKGNTPTDAVGALRDEYTVRAREIVEEEADTFSSTFFLFGNEGLCDLLMLAGTYDLLCAGRSKRINRESDDIGQAVDVFGLSAFYRALPDLVEKILPLADRLILVGRLLESLARELVAEKQSVLVFLPGLADINCLRWKIERQRAFEPALRNIQVCILHSSIPIGEQRQISSCESRARIILATNSAESSITIPAVKYVVDCCLGRHEVFEKVLKTERSSMDAALQREGRTGRVCDGTVYRVVSDMEWMCMRQFRKPLMFARGLADPMRMLLAQNVTQGDDTSPHYVLSVLNRMSCRSERQTWIRDEDLTELALRSLLAQAALSEVPCDSTNTDSTAKSFKLTSLGFLQSRLPLSWEWAMFLVIGSRLGIAAHCVHAALYCGSFVSFYQGSSAKAHYRAGKLCGGTYSECIAAIAHLRELNQNLAMGKEPTKEDAPHGLPDISNSLSRIAQLLHNEGLISKKCRTTFSKGLSSASTPATTKLILITWAATFYENVAEFLPPPASQFVKENTVRFREKSVRDRSIVVAYEEEESKVMLFSQLNISVDEKPETTRVLWRELTNDDWAHEKAPATPATKFYVLTFPPDPRTMWGVHYMVWLAEKSIVPGLTVMGCGVWRAHRELDEWVPYGSIHLGVQGSEARPRLDYFGICHPVFSRERLLVFPAAIGEFYAKSGKAVSAQHGVSFLPPGGPDGGGAADSTPIILVLACLRTQEPAERAFDKHHEQVSLDDDIPEEWENLTVCRGKYVIPLRGNAWIRSPEFRFLRQAFCYSTREAWHQESKAKDATFKLLDMIGYTAVLDKWLEDVEEAQVERPAPAVNPDYGTTLEDLEAEHPDIGHYWNGTDFRF